MDANTIVAAHKAGQCANLSADGRSCTCSNELAALLDTPAAAPATDFNSLYEFFQNLGMGTVRQYTEPSDRRKGLQVISYPYKVGQTVADKAGRQAAAIVALVEAGYTVHPFTGPRCIYINTNA